LSRSFPDANKGPHTIGRYALGMFEGRGNDRAATLTGAWARLPVRSQRRFAVPPCLDHPKGDGAWSGQPEFA
jgi:hypothetical protein